MRRRYCGYAATLPEHDHDDGGGDKAHRDVLLWRPIEYLSGSRARVIKAALERRADGEKACPARELEAVPTWTLMLARIFAIACDANYEPGLHALLNSLWVYYRGELAIFVYHRGLSRESLERLAGHPNRPHLHHTTELPFPAAGMWEAKQQVFAHCIGRACCVYLLDADLVLTSRVDDVFELAEQGKIVSSADGAVQTFGPDYMVYGRQLPGTRMPYVNSGALCLDVNRHWDLAGLWAFASQFGSYSPRQGHPLQLPGHGDQGMFNAIAALLGKARVLHVLPEATWCDSSEGTSLQIKGVTPDGGLEVWNVFARERQRLVHSTGPKWWTECGRAHLQRFGDKLRCFEHFQNYAPTE